MSKHLRRYLVLSFLGLFVSLFHSCEYCKRDLPELPSQSESFPPLQWTTDFTIGYPFGSLNQGVSFLLGNKVFVGGGRWHDGFFSSIDEGLTWQAEPEMPAGYGERYEAVAFVLNGRAYVAAGVRYNPPFENYKDVWSTADGKTWVREPDLPPAFEARSGAVSFVFNGRAYIAGGGTKTNVLKDVWSTADGKTWTKEPDMPGPLANSVSFVLQGKAFIATGSDGIKEATRTVYSTVDGKIWVKEQDDPNLPAFNDAVSYVLGNKAFIATGLNDQGGLNTQIWSTANGQQWNFESTMSIDHIRWGSVSFVINNKAFISSGQFPWPIFINDDVIMSQDGGLFNEIAHIRDDYQRRMNTSVFTINNRVFIAAGQTDHFLIAFTKDVWSSADGKVWDREPDPPADFSERGSAVNFTLNGRVFIAGGRGKDGSVFFNDVWSTADGKNWTSEPDLPPNFEPRSDAVTFTLQNKVFVATGKSANGLLKDVWSTADGKSWTKEPDLPPGFEARTGAVAFTAKGRAFIATGFVGGNNFRRDVWSTTDGKIWTKEPDLPVSFAPRFEAVAFNINGKAYIGGGSDVEHLKNITPMSDVWSTTDGKSWVKEQSMNNKTLSNENDPNEKFVIGQAAAATCLFNGKVYVAGGVNDFGICFTFLEGVQ